MTSAAEIVSSAAEIVPWRALAELLMVMPHPETKTLESCLGDVADITSGVVSSADGAVIVLVAPDGEVTVAASSGFSAVVSTGQLRLGEGPAVSAKVEGRSIYVPALRSDTRWPIIGALAAEEGVGCALSVPLRIDERITGTLDFYARPTDVFTDRQINFAEDFAAPVALKVHALQALVVGQRIAAGLEAALSERATIDRAVGILMSRSGGSANEAFQYLQLASASRRQSTGTVAGHLVDQAVRRAIRRVSDEPRPP
jgi:transcriptional regulator with GAF, ATPase, and Fis domain